MHGTPEETSPEAALHLTIKRTVSVTRGECLVNTEDD
jgi:hypothetical protein